jgi:hypothetical protein
VSPLWQTPVPSQQPLGHVVSLHVEPTHAPAWQTAPTTHSAQVSPPVPQLASAVPARHFPVAAQHPVAHVAALHVPWQLPPSHVAPAVHAAQRLPPVPHACDDDPAWQLPLASQQPVGHVCESHIGAPQKPSSQTVPGGHAEQNSPSSPHAFWLVPGWQTLS